MSTQGSPRITEMQVIPVAGYDSMLMSLSGAHAPFFTRNLVILTDNNGNTGVGEVHGGEFIRKALESYIPLVVGQQVGDYKNIIATLKRNSGRTEGEGLQKLDLKKMLTSVVNAEVAVECALLDLFGQFLGLPVCALLGEGQKREEIPILAYLFYVQEKNKTNLPYLEEGNGNDWFSLRRKTAITPESIVEQAYATAEKYGMKDFKLKGGVFSGEAEMQAIVALKKAFPDARINLDPNGAWSLQEAVSLCKGMGDVLTYIEDPCGEEGGFSGREIMAEFKAQTGLPVATNMIATNWRQLRHAIANQSIDIVLADPHFWTMSGSVRCGQMLNDFDLVWGSHSNNHFDISLALSVHVAAACPGEITAMDTHWIWQDGQDLCDNAYKIIDGKITVPTLPGLGLKLNMEKVLKANELYNQLSVKDRDDSIAMQFLIPDWKFDHKKPCMVR